MKLPFKLLNIFNTPVQNLLVSLAIGITVVTGVVYTNIKNQKPPKGEVAGISNLAEASDVRFELRQDFLTEDDFFQEELPSENNQKQKLTYNSDLNFKSKDTIGANTTTEAPLNSSESGSQPETGNKNNSEKPKKPDNFNQKIPENKTDNNKKDAPENNLKQEDSLIEGETKEKSDNLDQDINTGNTNNNNSSGGGNNSSSGNSGGGGNNNNSSSGGGSSSNNNSTEKIKVDSDSDENQPESQPKKVVSPFFHGVVRNTDPESEYQFLANFGYKNQNDTIVVIPAGSGNKFNIGEQNRGQVEAFKPGIQYYAFSVGINCGQTLVWTLTSPNGSTRTATASIPADKCLDKDSDKDDKKEGGQNEESDDNNQVEEDDFDQDSQNESDKSDKNNNQENKPVYIIINLYGEGCLAGAESGKCFVTSDYEAFKNAKQNPDSEYDITDPNRQNPKYSSPILIRDCSKDDCKLEIKKNSTIPVFEDQTKQIIVYQKSDQKILEPSLLDYLQNNPKAKNIIQKNQQELMNALNQNRKELFDLVEEKNWLINYLKNNPEKQARVRKFLNNQSQVEMLEFLDQHLSNETVIKEIREEVETENLETEISVYTSLSIPYPEYKITELEYWTFDYVNHNLQNPEKILKIEPINNRPECQNQNNKGNPANCTPRLIRSLLNIFNREYDSL